jgi:hypothetical protein
MLRVPFTVAALLTSLCVANPCVAVAEESGRGPAYPLESKRGPAFPKYVSPTQSNPTNWVAAPPIPEPAPTTRWWGRWRLWRHGFHSGRRR